MALQNQFRAGTREYYQAELKRLDKSNLETNIKKKVKLFLNHCENSDNLSFNRLYFHASNLRTLANDMGQVFLNPTVEDINEVISYQKQRAPYGRESGELSEWTIEGYKSTLKKFYKWIGKPEVVKDLKYKSKVNYKEKHDYEISQEEVDILIQACDNSRDKAIISLLFDSGIRIGELLTLRNKDVEYDQNGMRITVSGKTGVRKVRVFGDSVGYVKGWQNVHPDPFEEEAWLFCGIGHDKRGKSTVKEPLSHPQIYRMFGKVRKRAIDLGWPTNKRLNPHKFRHAFATRMATKLKEPLLEKTMGWTYASKMTRVYIHLNDEDADNAFLEANGLKVEKKATTVRKTRTCLSCKTISPSNSRYCIQCGRPLDIDESKLLSEFQENVVTNLKGMETVPDSLRGMLSAALSPETELQIASLIVDSIAKDPIASAKFLKEYEKRKGK